MFRKILSSGNLSGGWNSRQADPAMDTTQELPSFDTLLPDLNRFIHGLVDDYKAGAILSWDDLAAKVNAFFTPESIDQTEAIVPHWRKMYSYADGITLVHVMCVFMGLYMLPEFLGMPNREQQMMKWVILFHDIEKEVLPGKRDFPHAFRSAVGAAQTLPGLGFSTTPEYDLIFPGWSELTRSAVTSITDFPHHVQDNRKLPQILEGIERMFGQNKPATLIVKTVLFHTSVDMEFWPPPAPLTDTEMKRYFDKGLLSLLSVMHLADGEGWLIFDSKNRERGRLDTLKVFTQVERLIAESFQT